MGLKKLSSLSRMTQLVVTEPELEPRSDQGICGGCSFFCVLTSPPFQCQPEEVSPGSLCPAVHKLPRSASPQQRHPASGLPGKSCDLEPCVQKKGCCFKFTQIPKSTRYVTDTPPPERTWNYILQAAFTTLYTWVLCGWQACVTLLSFWVEGRSNYVPLGKYMVVLLHTCRGKVRDCHANSLSIWKFQLSE